jgi:hypothetical protein
LLVFLLSGSCTCSNLSFLELVKTSKSPYIAAFLSCLLPGLGLYYLGSKEDKGRGCFFFLVTIAGVIIWPLLLAWPASVIISYARALKLNRDEELETNYGYHVKSFL